MENIFLAVLELSYKASFLIIAVALLRLVLKRAPRHMICALWLLVGLRLVLPFSIESSFSLVPDADYAVSIQQTEPANPESSAAPLPGVTAPQISYSPIAPVITTPPAEISPAPPAPTEPEHSPLSAEQIASAVWLCGFGLMLAYLAVSYALLRRQLRESVPAGNGVWKCAAVHSPFVLGFFRPRIYLSHGISAGQEEYVLTHERSHIARRDHLTKPIGFLVLALHWFNPLVWLAYVLMCRDIELACDERVIKGLDAPGRKAYSHALLSCAVKASSLAACPLAFGELGVKKRIKNILSYKKPTVLIVLAALICAIAVGALFLTDPIDSSAPKELRRAIVKTLDNRYIKDYELVDIEEKNPLLYSFTFNVQQNIVYIPASDSAGSVPRPVYVENSYTEYAYYLHNEWKLTVSFGDVPGHILRGVPFDCPDAVWETVNAYLDARSSSMEEAQPYYYTYRDSRYNNSIRLLEYDIDHIEKQNELLYSFKWTGRREWNEGDALYYRKTGERRRTASELGYVFLIDGEWKIASAFEYIPAHILRGEDESTVIPSEAPASYDCPDAVADAYKRYIASITVGSGDRETWQQLIYRGEDVPAIDDPLMFSADLLTDRIESVTRVNDSLYEFLHAYTSKYLDYKVAMQHFVGLIDGSWRIMLYDAVPDALRSGLENVDRWTWDDEGNRVIIPAGSYSDPELPVEAHLMDKLKFYLPAMHSFGTYDLYLGVSGGMPIYYADGTLCGHMELNRAMEATIENGEIVFADDGANHASFISEFESIDHSVPCAIAQYSDDSGGYYWYVVFAKANAGFCYGLKLDNSYFSREEAIRMALSVRFTAEAFAIFDDDERMYWPIIDAYAAALSQGLTPTDLRSLGLNEDIGDSDDPLGDFGWVIKDLDGRGHPELLIGEQSIAGGIGTPIYALYTCDAEHLVMEVFSGSTRSMYYYVSDSYFLHRLSAGIGNGSETWYRFYGDYLTELDAAPDTKVYGTALTPFSAIMGYSSSCGAELTGDTPQTVFPDWDDPAEYALSNGLELGMDYSEIIAIMGLPERIETQHSAYIAQSIYYLTYPGEARLCLMAELNAPVEESKLWSAQIYSDTISLGRMGDSGRRINEICPLYGINPVIIESGSEYLPVLQNLPIPHDGYYDSAIALVPRDEGLWENGPPPCAALLFKDGELQCVYLCYAVAADFRFAVSAPQ